MRQTVILDRMADKANSISNQLKATTEVLSDGTEVRIEPYGGIIALASDREPWERQPGEPNRAWVFYKYFQDMPAETRTLDGAYRRALIALGKLTPDQQTAQSPEWFRIYAQQYQWKERVRARDMYEAEVADRALMAARISARLTQTELGQLLIEKALEAAKLIQTVTIQKDAQGRAVLRSNLTVGEIAKLAHIGSSIENAALGLGTSGSGTSVAVNLQVGVQDALSDDQVVRRAEQILSRRKELIDAEAESR